MTEDQKQERKLPTGVRIGLAANTAAVIAGAVFFTADSGARFRGMEPEAQFFLTVSFLAIALGFFAGLPVSVYDCFRGRGLSAALGCILACTPLPVATIVAGLAAYMFELTWD